MICALIVAGGSGLRMLADQRKQYLELGGVSILGRTIAAFDRSGLIDRIVVVVPADDLAICQDRIVAPLKLAHPVQIVAGGSRRQDSVRAGLAAIDTDDATVMIHDGVRPFVRTGLIRDCLEGVGATGACIPAIEATDTLKKVDAQGVVQSTLDRTPVRLAQTPQTFFLDLIRGAHQRAARHGFAATDDASIAEWDGARVMVVAGDRDNIKITHPDDLPRAEAILARWRGDTD